jgi:hypothetical protein
VAWRRPRGGGRRSRRERCSRARTAGEEIRKFIGEHFEKRQHRPRAVGVGERPSSAAPSGVGFGASASRAPSPTGARIEVEPGKPPALVLEQSVQRGGLAGARRAGRGSRRWAGTLNGGSHRRLARPSRPRRACRCRRASIVGDARERPCRRREAQIGSERHRERDHEALARASTCTQASSTEGLGLNLGADGGLAIELSGEAKTKDHRRRAGPRRSLKGDLERRAHRAGHEDERSTSR